MNKKKAVVLICAFAIMIPLFILLPKEANEVTNAIVNTENGDIAFCYYDSSGITSHIRVDAYNAKGELLFSKPLVGSDGSYASLMFSDGMLYASDRSDKKYCFDMTGKKCDASDVSSVQIDKAGAFSGWKSSFGKRTFEYGDIRYVYELPMIFKDRCTLTLERQDGRTVLYEHPSAGT